MNEVLQRYEASHGINKNKEKFHHMWGKGEVDFFLKRPMNKDYRDYCIKDVLDLPEVHDKMLASVSEWEFSLSKWISAHYVLFGYQISNH
ncbi:MAG: hypothetical protein KBD76_15590 [Bacteriovorax sp.]|nr:hypothetical protein [Bacteriovorax sp.]